MEKRTKTEKISGITFLASVAVSATLFGILHHRVNYHEHLFAEATNAKQVAHETDEITRYQNDEINTVLGGGAATVMAESVYLMSRRNRYDAAQFSLHSQKNEQLVPLEATEEAIG